MLILMCIGSDAQHGRRDHLACCRSHSDREYRLPRINASVRCFVSTDVSGATRYWVSATLVHGPGTLRNYRPAQEAAALDNFVFMPIQRVLMLPPALTSIAIAVSAMNDSSSEYSIRSCPSSFHQKAANCEFIMAAVAPAYFIGRNSTFLDGRI